MRRTQSDKVFQKGARRITGHVNYSRNLLRCPAYRDARLSVSATSSTPATAVNVAAQMPVPMPVRRSADGATGSADMPLVVVQVHTQAGTVTTPAALPVA
jgi:hypothetical protein